MAFNRNTVKLGGRKQHPLLTAIRSRKLPYSDIARALDVTPQALACWMRECAKNKNFLLPAEQVPALSRTLKVPPAKLRPDLYEPQWVFS